MSRLHSLSLDKRIGKEIIVFRFSQWLLDEMADIEDFGWGRYIGNDIIVRHKFKERLD
jgi:hypothetical protein